MMEILQYLDELQVVKDKLNFLPEGSINIEELSTQLKISVENIKAYLGYLMKNNHTNNFHVIENNGYYFIKKDLPVSNIVFCKNVEHDSTTNLVDCFESLNHKTLKYKDSISIFIHTNNIKYLTNHYLYFVIDFNNGKQSQLFLTRKLDDISNKDTITNVHTFIELIEFKRVGKYTVNVFLSENEISGTNFEIIETLNTGNFRLIGSSYYLVQ